MKGILVSKAMLLLSKEVLLLEVRRFGQIKIIKAFDIVEEKVC